MARSRATPLAPPPTLLDSYERGDVIDFVHRSSPTHLLRTGVFYKDSANLELLCPLVSGAWKKPLYLGDVRVQRVTRAGRVVAQVAGFRVRS